MRPHQRFKRPTKLRHLPLLPPPFHHLPPLSIHHLPLLRHLVAMLRRFRSELSSGPPLPEPSNSSAPVKQSEASPVSPPTPSTSPPPPLPDSSPTPPTDPPAASATPSTDSAKGSIRWVPESDASRSAVLLIQSFDDKQRPIVRKAVPGAAWGPDEKLVIPPAFSNGN